MILQIDDWQFDIDMERTMEYSAAEAAEHCDCAYCRNFYASVDDGYPELRPFLAQFGIDMEAPEEMCPFAEESILYDPTYKVYGKILRFGSLEMSCGPVNLVARASEDAEGCFLLDCYEVFLPWILEEPFAEVVSTANEPSFLKKMWDRLLGRAKNSDLTS